MRVFIKALIITSLALITFSSQATHMAKETIDKRTSPVGQVHLEGIAQESSTQTAKASTAPAEPRTGDALYNTFCIACHSIGLANAPKTGDTEAWNKVLEIGIDALVISAKIGKNVMPAMGNCADCTDDELISVINFMSEAKN
ncbi:MAG: cytochrome c5 [Enterobacterales bacterium]|jgi:cytochrome c5